MKISIIGNTANAMILFRLDLIKTLTKKGISVYAFATDYNDSSKEIIKKAGAIPVDYNLSRSGINLVGDLWNTYLLSKKLKKIKPDAILSFFSKPSVFGSLAGIFSGVKNNNAMLEGLGFLFTEQPHGTPLKTKLLKNIQVLLYKIIFPHINSLILLNKDDYHDLIDKYKIKLKSCHILGGIGLDMNHYCKSTPPTNEISFIFIARLLAEKGVNEFVAAAKKIKKTNFLQLVFGNKTVKVISGDASDPILYMYGIDRNIPIIDTLRDRVKIARKESGIFEVANRS